MGRARNNANETHSKPIHSTNLCVQLRRGPNLGRRIEKLWAQDLRGAEYQAIEVCPKAPIPTPAGPVNRFIMKP